MSAEDAAAELARLFTSTEAAKVADRLCAGETLTMALRAVSTARRPQARALLQAIAAADASQIQVAVAVLRAIEAARSQPSAARPIWTMPGHLAHVGALTGSIVHLVDNARQSVTCSTFNFQRSSMLWAALAQAAQRPEMTVRVYLDAAATRHHDGVGSRWNVTPSAEEIAAHLRPGIVFRSRPFDGLTVRNHAKFVIVDHRFLLVTSANFSWSAENGNVEFGVLHDNSNLAESVEREMRNAEDAIFERVAPGFST